MSKFQAFVANSNIVVLSGLKDQATDTFVNTATVTAVVTDKKGNLIDLVSTADDYPIAMPFQTGSDGVYIGVLPPELALVHDVDYIAEVTAVQGGTIGFWRIAFRAKNRDV